MISLSWQELGHFFDESELKSVSVPSFSDLGFSRQNIEYNAAYDFSNISPAGVNLEFHHYFSRGDRMVFVADFELKAGKTVRLELNEFLESATSFDYAGYAKLANLLRDRFSSNSKIIVPKHIPASDCLVKLFKTGDFLSSEEYNEVRQDIERFGLKYDDVLLDGMARTDFLKEEACSPLWTKSYFWPDPSVSPIETV
jgi:hypothetical protein